MVRPVPACGALAAKRTRITSFGVGGKALVQRGALRMSPPQASDGPVGLPGSACSAVLGPGSARYDDGRRGVGCVRGGFYLIGIKWGGSGSFHFGATTRFALLAMLHNICNTKVIPFSKLSMLFLGGEMLSCLPIPLFKGYTIHTKY